MVLTIHSYVNFKATVQRMMYDNNAHTSVFYRDDGSGNARWVYAFCNGGNQVVYGDLSTASATVTDFLADFPAAIAITENYTFS